MLPEAALAAGAALARELFLRLARETADPPGVTRIAYGEGERLAHALAREAAESFGAEAAWDPAGNLLLTLPGADRGRMILIGSHLDSVPHGGDYDGTAGVFLGLALQKALVEAGVRPPVDLVTIALRAEESCWFPHSYIGSRTALGILDPGLLDSLRRSDSGRTLAEHIAEEGFDPDAVRAGRRLIDPSRVVAYVEPHVEQGPALLAAGCPLALVTGIRGSFRYREAHCRGAYAHSGATPREARRDAVLATAELVVALDRLWEELEGHDLTVTCGMLSTDPEAHAFSKVAGLTRFCLDIRSQSRESLDLVHERLLMLTGGIAERRAVRFELGPRTGSEPAPMSPDVLRQLGNAAARAGVPVREMASGAGHDAATFALQGIPSAMIFIRNEHGSHNPDEHMDMADFESALRLLAAVEWESS